MMRQGKLWLALALIAGVAVFGMAALTSRLLALDAAQAQAERDAWVEENVRLALWRMDSKLAGLLTQAVAAIDTLTEPPEAPGADPLASPQDDAPPSCVPWSPETAWWRAILETSPDAPPKVVVVVGDPNSREDSKDSTASEDFMSTLTGILPKEDMASFLQALEALAPEAIPVAPNDVVSQNADPDMQQSMMNRQEYAARAQIVQEANVAQSRLPEQSPSTEDWSAGDPVVSLWWRGNLLIARAPRNADAAPSRVMVANWNWIEKDLRELVADILPNVTLLPVPSTEDREGSRSLAALPIAIDPGVVPMARVDDAGTIRAVLWIAWTALALAIVATAILVGGIVALSERRAAFVSSVTHELRTPLTTLRMYSEMLSEGFVTDADKRRDYLSTIRGEADRLGTLVENVLAYARLERQGKRENTSAVPLSSLLPLLEGRIRSRAEEAGFALRVQPLTDGERQVLADPVAVEQILFNLVDNACKYAANGSDRSINVSFDVGKRSVWIAVADHGLGIEKASRSALFRPFSRSPNSASPSTPGVGLGLALSRQMARQMRGDLRLNSSNATGAKFELRLQAV